MDKKLVGSDGYCYVCGNKGLLDVPCPSCGREPKKLSIHLEERQDNVFVDRIDCFGVPGKYRGLLWNVDVLRKMHSNLDKDRAFQRFVSQLEKIDSLFVKGLISSKSAIIIAPAGFSKVTFAYSCMQRALDYGLSVAPFLDTDELKRLLVLSSERPNYRLFDSISYDSYVMSDICFVTVSKLPSREWAYNVIQELLDVRSRKGLGTFIMSRYGLDEISRRDASNQFGVISTAESSDDFKYPAVIRYKPI